MAILEYDHAPGPVSDHLSARRMTTFSGNWTYLYLGRAELRPEPFDYSLSEPTHGLQERVCFEYATVWCLVLSNMCMRPLGTSHMYALDESIAKLYTFLFFDEWINLISLLVVLLDSIHHRVTFLFVWRMQKSA